MHLALQRAAQPAPRKGTDLSDTDPAYGMIEEAVRELGVRFLGAKNGALLFKRGRFDPSQNLRLETLRRYIIETLSALAVAEAEPEVRKALVRLTHDGITISIS